MMTLQKIQALLENHPWQSQITYYDETGSTNTLAKLLAKEGAPAGTVLIADRQNAGRGRLGRNFQSPAGMGVYLSCILRPNCPPGDLMHLTCAVAAAMCNAVEEAAGFRPGIKWTNDLIFGTRKLGGILTELSIDPATRLAAAAIVGIGINCCQKEADFDPSIRDMAGSLSMAAGKPVDRNILAAAMIRALFQMNSVLLTDKSGIMNRYRADCRTIGKEVSILRGDEVFHAKAVDLDENGGLIVRHKDGRLETVSSGEVSVRGLYGYIS